jgi:hypothetical protein
VEPSLHEVFHASSLETSLPESKKARHVVQRKWYIFRAAYSHVIKISTFETTDTEALYEGNMTLLREVAVSPFSNYCIAHCCNSC